MKNRTLALIAAVVVMVLSNTSLIAQVDTGAIVGTVTDAAGATVSGANVTATEENTGVKLTSTTHDDGNYSMSPLKIGVYTVSVEMSGFRTSIRQHIEVTIQSRLEVNFKLQIGATSESVQVDASAPLIETQSSSMQQLVEARAINNLPLNGRNASFLAQLSPGVTFAQNDGRNLQASGSFTANGMRRTQNNYLLDGMDNNASIGDLVNQSQYVVMPPPDALREFTVQTSTYTAEFGHAAGGVLNVSTKSGTNAFHGNLWEFLRNDIFDAKDYFVQANQSKPKFRQNQFGGTIGGPLSIPKVYDGHNRTFFFADYQGTRIVQGKTYSKSVPTMAERNSDFTNLQDLISLQTNTVTDALGRKFPLGTVFDPATTRKLLTAVDPVTGLPGAVGSYVRDPFYSGSIVGKANYTDAGSKASLNNIPASRINQNAVALLKLYPEPTGSGLTANYISSPNNVTSTDSFDTRIDHQFSSRDSAFLRYSFVYTTQTVPGPFPGIADGGDARPGSGKTESQVGALSWTHIFTTRLVNEARVGYSRVYDKRLQPGSDTMGIPDQYGIPGVPQIAQNGGLPLFQFGQLGNLGAATSMPSDKASDVLQLTENLSIDRDRHQLRTGFEFQDVAFPMLSPTAPRGNFTHSGSFTSVVASTDSSTDRAQFILNPIPSSIPGGAAAGGVDYLGGANTLSATNFPLAYHPFRHYYGAYVQDSWRATSNLTLNAGVRYEYIGGPAERDGRFGNFVSSYTGDTPDGLSHYYLPKQHVAELPTDFINLLAANNVQLTPTNDNLIGIAQKTNFAPRLGFVYQPVSKVSIRGGYGLFYQPNENHGLSISPYINFPFQVTTSYTAGSSVTPTTADATAGPISEGLLNVPLDPATASVSALAFQGEPRYPKTTYSQSFNLQVQYQVANNMVLFVGYVGSNSRHVQDTMGTNTTNKITVPTTSLKTIAFFPTITTGGNYVSRNGASNYNSLQFGAERRFASGLSFMANMTWSKCMGDIHDMLDNGVGGFRAPYVAGMGLGADTTLCDTDVRRIVHTSGTYELPFGKGRRFLQTGLANVLAGGWSTNWIFTAQDGQPLSIACSTTNATGLGCFALKVPGQDPYTKSNIVQHFLNAAAFVNPPAATATSASIANLGGPGGQVTGPPFRRFDLSIFRQFPFIHESYFQFRAEAFNVTNTPNFGQPSGTNITNTSTFGQITSTRDNPNDPRELQFSLKYYF